MQLNPRYHPEFLSTYHALQTPVERADAWRYHVLCTHGGIYTDTDTLCAAPFDEWADRTRAAAAEGAAGGADRSDIAPGADLNPGGHHYRSYLPDLRSVSHLRSARGVAGAGGPPLRPRAPDDVGLVVGEFPSCRRLSVLYLFALHLLEKIWWMFPGSVSLLTYWSPTQNRH
jgi:hypothetical protein